MTTRFLIIGDPHAVQGELDDCQALVDFSCKIALEERVDRVVVLGDLHHHHSIVHVDVMTFWLKALNSLRAATSQLPVVIVGNHDRSTDKTARHHALAIYENHALVVDRTVVLDDGVAVVPYLHDPGRLVEMIEEVRSVRPKGPLVLMCHQTFDGSSYENGFYAKDGIAADPIAADLIISGHIHKPQRFGKVWYPGSPRWRTLSDANEQRAIWVVDVDDGSVVSDKSFDTAGVCRTILRTKYQDGTVVYGPDPFGGSVDNLSCRSMWHFDLHGDREQNRELAERLTAVASARIRTHDTTTIAPAVRESDGIMRSFEKYLSTFDPATHSGTPLSVLDKMVRDRISP